MNSVPEVLVGLALQPHEETLALLEPILLREAELFEITPETLWFHAGDGSLRPNDYWRTFERLRAATGRPFVSHGVGWSVGSASDLAERDARWLAALERTHAAFDLAWATDHLGASVLAGDEVLLPMPVPMTDAMADHVRARLARLQRVVPDVGLENTAWTFVLGDVREEPAFLARALAGEGLHLLLDLHNLLTTATNHDADPFELLGRMPIERVIEIHLAGGSTSPPEWLASGVTRRLDSHDAAVPEVVWELLDAALPRCASLRAIVLERMEGTVADEADARAVGEELRRARTALARRRA